MIYYSSSPASECKAVNNFEDQYLFKRHTMTLSAVAIFSVSKQARLASPKPAGLKLFLAHVTKLAICH